MTDSKQIRPSHYVVELLVAKAGISDGTVVEVVDLIAALGLDFNRGNALKYLIRAGRKEEDGADALSDYKKALTYATFVVDELLAERATQEKNILDLKDALKAGMTAKEKESPSEGFPLKVEVTPQMLRAAHTLGGGSKDDLIIGVDLAKGEGTDHSVVTAVAVGANGAIVATGVGKNGDEAMRNLEGALVNEEPPAPWLPKPLPAGAWRCAMCGEVKTSSERYPMNLESGAVGHVCALCEAKHLAANRPTSTPKAP